VKRTYNKREIITDTSFDFTKQRIQYQIQYQGNGKAPDKRFDRSTQGLCLFIYPSGVKVFCAIKKFSMYNKIKNRTEKNAVYKKIFRMEDHPQRDYAAAKHDNDYLIHRVVWTTLGRLESNKSYVLS
jgi:hypothetical protein